MTRSRPSRRTVPEPASQRAATRGVAARGRASARTPAARSRALPALAIALLAAALYLPGIRNGFAYDAVMLVEEDSRVHSLERPARLLASSYWPGGEETLALYRPLVTLSFATDWALFGGAPAGFHLSTALAHAAASVLLFLLLAGLVSTPAAFAGAALFAVHPVQTEAVASIVGRADIYAAGLCFAALLAWSRLPARSTALRVAVPALFLLALGSKESAIVLPALLVLLDAAAGRISRARLREWLRERAWPLAGMTLVAISYLAARAAVLGGLAPQSLNPIMAAIPSGATRLRSALQVWPEILRLFVFPWTLLADYGPRILMPAGSWTPRALTGFALLAGAILGGVLALVRGRGRTGFALLWTPIALLPVSNLILPIGVLLAERTLYIATFALALGVALGVDAVAGRPRGLRAALVACAIAGTLFATRTVLRLPSWRSTDEVFRTLLRDRPDSYRAHWHHARMAWRDGDPEAAAGFYRSTLELWPYARPVFLEAGLFASETGRERDARAFAEQGLGHWPDDATLLRRLAVACLNLSDTTAARVALERGLRIAPDDPLFLALKEAIGTARPR